MKNKEKDDAPPGSPPKKVLYDNRIKRKNVLALNEKVNAIREYEKMPVYKRIGRMFQCSPDQIKRIVQQKDAILKAWEQRTRRVQDAKTLEMKVVRVSMLGKAVYEWIRRMMYYKDFMITDGLIQKMALQFKSAMGLQNFFPHPDWCDKFRKTYKITKNDSKLLKIGYSQGHSVQIMDVMKDVLSECTPDVLCQNSDTDDNDDEHGDNDDDENDRNSDDLEPPKSSISMTRPTTSKEKSAESAANAMPQLKPMRQLVALPLQANGSAMSMSQKVLVATPIRTAGQLNGASPMTMTIIPLTTLAQQSQPNAQSVVAGEKHSVPPPMVQIKREIKRELKEVSIKEEYISDDDDILEVITVSTTESPSPIDTTGTAKKSIAAAIRDLRETADDHSEMDTMDYDNLALSSLRKLIQNQSAATATEIPAMTVIPTPIPKPTPTRKHTPTSIQVSLPALKLRTIPSSTTVTVAAGLNKRMPPLPPLTKAPTMVNRTANKRKHNTDATPTLPAIKTCSEARKYLKLLEDFALFKENFRLIGLITRADEVLRELDGDEDVDVD